MSNDTVMTVTVKGIGDFSDVVSNVGSVQKALTKLKLPDKLGDSLNKNITNFYKEYEKYQKKISEGIKTQGDYNQVEKSLNNMRNLYQAIGKDAQKLTDLDMKDILNLDTGEFKKIMNEMTSVMKQIGSVKIDTSPFTKAFKDIQGITKNSKIVGEDGLLNKIIGSVNTGQIAEAKKQLQELQNYAKKVAPRTTVDGKQAPGTLSPEKYQQLTSAIDTMNGAVTKAETAINPLIEKHNNLQKELDETKQKAAQSIKNEFKGYNQASGEVEKLTDSLRRMHEEEFNFNREAQNIDRQIQSYFGLSQMIRKVGDIAKDAFATVKELDKAMTETAVVTNFSVGDMWDMLPTYTVQANQLGSTIKDVYEAATLYYQQGLNTNQAMGLANETLKMARIAGLGAAEATDMMTAALRGFNMEINQQSAQKINDIYSELAAITASDTAEIGSAMERTASIANSANMEFATTSAFLAQMIETTREAPENLGTAMKTIVARFQEMKQDPTKLIDSEGVAMDANKVDKALKTIGVNLMNTKGEFRDLDDVFLDISQRWDSLTQGQQRYIATIAAGSRQQSRFIAMMSNYERTMELVDAANNSAGASQRQFEKTLDSMEAKLNKLKNAWDQFTMGLMNNQLIKLGVDALTKVFTITNKTIDVLGSIPAKPFEGITKSALTLVATLSMLNFGKKAARGMVMGGAAWYKGEQGGFTKNFAQGFKGGSIEAQTSGNQAGITWAQAASRAINSNSSTLKGAMHNAFNMQEAGSADLIQQNLTFALQKIQSASNNFGMGENGKEAGDAFVEGLIEEVKNGQTSINGALQQALNMGETDLNIGDLGEEIQQASRASLDLDKISINFKDLAKTASSAGDSIREFGYALQGTPLEGFGNTLIRIGNLMDSVSRTAQTFGKNFNKAMEAAGKASGAGGKASTFLGTMFPNLSKIIGLIGKLPLQLKIIAAVLAIVGAIALKTAHDQKKALESATDAAAAASDAYDSAKQETSELADSIEKIKETDSAFDGLVAGTAAFNEQLVVANSQIMELIKKYPMLNDPKYLSTDKNGLMHISDEGLDAVKDYQKQLQANASALNLIQTADLNSVEAQQKAKQMRKTKGTDTLESLVQRKQEADLIEQQAEAQQQMAKLNAVNTALVDKEIGNREKVSAILADQYDSRRKAISLEGESIHDLKQEYADFYGYKYDKSTKKMTDIEGNEIDVDKATIKDAVKDIRILTDIEVDGKSLDNMINHIDSTFSQALGSGFEESGNLFSDILSDNIDIEDDLLQNLLTNPDKLQSAVDSLSEKEIAAVLGVSADAVEQAPDKYKDELTNKLTEKATNIAETQAQSYADLATMLAQTTSGNIDQIISENGRFITQAQVRNKQAIEAQLEQLTSEQKNILSSIGKTLNESAGTDTMRTFIKQATDIYTKGTKKSIDTLDKVIKDVNWSSPTARLKAYNDMINSTDKDVQNLGNSLRNSSESSNLLGEAFEEFYDSSDFQDMAKNMDKFTDASGRLNASSVHEMAQECNSLNNLLDTGAISAGGVASALNAMGRDGNITILDLNENLLKFLSTANQLEDVLSEAHSLIEGFDWGVDTGESKDFAVDSTKKWRELYEGGEFGNQQLENYAKFVLGQDRWNAELEKSGGNIEKALDSMSSDILKYSDGFDQAWEDMADSTNEKFKDFHYADNGDLIWETNGRTTQQLVEDLAEARGITQEWAKLMVEDFANYSYDFKTELANNDFAAALKNGDYITSRTGKSGELNMTQNELATLAAAQNKTEEEILSDIQKYGKISEDQLNVIKTMDEKGNLLMGNGDIASINTQYSQAELGKDTDKSWISQYTAKTRQEQTIEDSADLKAAISGAIADGFQAEQATEMARAEAYQAFKDGAQVFYDGVELNEQDLADSQAFAEKIAEITENSRWNAVGEAIAQGYISYIQGTENLSNTDNNNQGSNWTSAKDGGEKTTNIDFSSNTPTEDPKEQAKQAAKEKFNSWIQGLIEGTNTPTEDPKIAAAEKSKENWKAIWDKVKEALSSGEGVEDPKTTAAEKAKENWKAIWDKVKEAFATNPDINIDPKTNKNNQPAQLETTETKGELNVTYTGKIANSDQLKSSLEQQITSLLNTIAAQQSKISATATVNVKQGTIEKPKAQKATVDYTKGKQAKAEKQTTTVDYKLGQQAAPKAKTTTVNYTLGHQAAPKPKTVDISPHFVGSWEKTITLKPSGAKGINNTIPVSHLPNLGSLAKGSKYGRLGPKGKGGLTLTGEKGFEIAWLPSESRSMILGTDGPQMINLPADAVVYTHEQSKDILKKRQTIDAGSHAGKHTKGGGKSKSKSKSKSSSKKKKSKKKSKKKKDKAEEKEITPTINNWSIEEAVRFNIDQSLATITEEISLRTKEIEKNLDKIGTTYDGIAGSTKTQLDSLKQVKSYNDELYASSARQLADYRAQQQYVSWTDANGESQRTLIAIGQYLNADGSINTGAIAGLAGNRALQEAVFQEVSGTANNLVNTMNKAKKASQDAQNQMDELGQKVSAAFFQWENELTQVYDLTQRINEEISLTNRFSAQVSLELAKLNAGFGTTSKSIDNIRKTLTRNNETIARQIQDQTQLITARKIELEEALGSADEEKLLKEYQNKGNWVSTEVKNATIAYQQQQVEGAKQAVKYITNLYRELDGSVRYNVDWNRIEQDRKAGNLSQTSYEALKKKIDELNDASTEYNNAIKDSTELIAEQYEQFREYQDTIADFEETLIDGLEEIKKNELDALKDISGSISDALSDLLDEVKRRLEERRQREDNLKTEQDISRKQQRLAALRANTAGGNQVEIAQLEQEITEAQQAYQRTLEDQLLDRLQQQGDEAARQREHQIELMEAQIEAEAARYQEEVNRWLNDPEKYKQQIFEVWKKANDYDSKGEIGQKILAETFNSSFTELVTAVEQTGFAEHFSAIQGDLNTLIGIIQNGPLGKKEDEVTKKNTQSATTLTKDLKGAQEALKAGNTVKQLKNLGFKDADIIKAATTKQLKEGGYSAKTLLGAGKTAADLKAGGYTAKELKDAGVSLANLKGLKYTATDLKSAGFTAQQLKGAGFGIKDLKGANFTVKDLKALYGIADLKAAGFTKASDFKTAGFTYAQLKSYFTNDELATAGYEEAKKIKAEQELKKKQDKYNNLLKSIINNTQNGFYHGEIGSIKKLLDAGKALGINISQIGQDLGLLGWTNHTLIDRSSIWWDSRHGFSGNRSFRDALYENENISWSDISALSNGISNGYNMRDRNSHWKDNHFIQERLKLLGVDVDKYKYKYYKTGGLNTTTGPAWLDGTPSKPELVLNSTDTKNFLALRDVLSKAMGSTKSINNSYGGDNIFEININVDKIEKDYDVDRVADRVKKKILDSSSYRNVTQVRNFR